MPRIVASAGGPSDEGPKSTVESVAGGRCLGIARFSVSTMNTMDLASVIFGASLVAGVWGLLAPCVRAWLARTDDDITTLWRGP